MSRDYGHFEVAITSEYQGTKLLAAIFNNCESLGWSFKKEQEGRFTQLGEVDMNWDKQVVPSDDFTSLIKKKRELGETFGVILFNLEDEYEQIEIQLSNQKISFFMSDGMLRFEDNQLLNVSHYTKLIISLLSCGGDYHLSYNVYVDWGIKMSEQT